MFTPALNAALVSTSVGVVLLTAKEVVAFWVTVPAPKLIDSPMSLPRLIVPPVVITPE